MGGPAAARLQNGRQYEKASSILHVDVCRADLCRLNVDTAIDAELSEDVTLTGFFTSVHGK